MKKVLVTNEFNVFFNIKIENIERFGESQLFNWNLRQKFKLELKY